MVSISGYGSNPSTLLHGVPQGSILSPILFLLYTQLLSQIIDRRSVSHSILPMIASYMIQFHVNNLTLCLVTCSRV